MISVRYDILVACPTCGGGLPIGGLAPTYKCPHCFTHTQPSFRVPAFFFDARQIRQAEIQPGKRHTGRLFTPDFAIERTVTLEWPNIDGRRFTLADIEANPAACNARRATEADKKALPGLKWVVGEVLTGTLPEDAKKTVVNFACLSCGSTLKIDGQKRVIDCEYCHSSNYLPDALWAQLHPVHKVSGFYTIIDETERGSLAAQLFWDPDTLYEELKADRQLTRDEFLTALHSMESNVHLLLRQDQFKDEDWPLVVERLGDLNSYTYKQLGYKKNATTEQIQMFLDIGAKETNFIGAWEPIATAILANPNATPQQIETFFFGALSVHFKYKEEVAYRYSSSSYDDNSDYGSYTKWELNKLGKKAAKLLAKRKDLTPKVILYFELPAQEIPNSYFFAQETINLDMLKKKGKHFTSEEWAQLFSHFGLYDVHWPVIAEILAKRRKLFSQPDEPIFAAALNRVYLHPKVIKQLYALAPNDEIKKALKQRSELSFWQRLFL